MGKIHEALAAEKTVNATWDSLNKETQLKMTKPEYFAGHTKTLKMLKDGEANAALESAAREHREMPTTVAATLEWAFGAYAKVEDLQLGKNLANQKATADVMFEGAVLFAGLPVDQLLGMESRLGEVRKIFLALPTLDAGKSWAKDPTMGNFVWVAPPEITTKTDKVMTAVVLYEATDKHPAQIEKVGRDDVIGTFSLTRRSGCITAVQKSELIKRVDDLIVEVKKARMRANEFEVPKTDLGDKLTEFLLAPLAN